MFEFTIVCHRIFDIIAQYSILATVYLYPHYPNSHLEIMACLNFRVSPVDGKGLGAVATEPIAQGRGFCCFRHSPERPNSCNRNNSNNSNTNTSTRLILTVVMVIMVIPVLMCRLMGPTCWLVTKIPKHSRLSRGLPPHFAKVGPSLLNSEPQPSLAPAL